MSRIDTEIKQASAEDISFVKEIEIECGLSAWSKEDYLQEINRDDKLFFVASNNEKPVGFILARLIMFETNISKEFEIEIYNIAVKKEFRRKKIASLLVEEIVKTGREKGVVKIHLEVRESNMQSLEFYQQNLFQAIGKRRNFYANPTDNAILMCRNLVEEKNT